jgi:DNA-binding NtrC family response regulator
MGATIRGTTGTEEPSARRRDRPAGLLIVDDDEGVRCVLGRGLRHRGFDVRLAANGPHAVEVYGAHAGSMDMVLLDVLMPTQDGVWTLTALRALDPQVHACFMTGNSGRYTEQELLDFSGLAVFHKPIKLGQLADQLMRLIDLSRLREWLVGVAMATPGANDAVVADPAVVPTAIAAFAVVVE